MCAFASVFPPDVRAVRGAGGVKGWCEKHQGEWRSQQYQSAVSFCIFLSLCAELRSHCLRVRATVLTNVPLPGKRALFIPLLLAVAAIGLLHGIFSGGAASLRCEIHATMRVQQRFYNDLCFSTQQHSAQDIVSICAPALMSPMSMHVHNSVVASSKRICSN